MGAIFSCCLPKRISYIKVEPNDTSQQNGEVPTAQVTEQERSYKEIILENVSRIVKDLLKTKEDDIERGDNIPKKISRGGKSQICELGGDVMIEEFNVDDNFVFVDEVMSDDEIESILYSCSTSPVSIIPDDNDVVMEQTTVSAVEQALIDMEHINLCRSPSDFPKLKELMESSLREHLVHKYIDREDSFGNTAVSVALLESNATALIYLIKKCFAAVPTFIHAEEHSFLFLIYVARNKDLRFGDFEGRHFLLYTIMKEMALVTNVDYHKNYLCTPDPTYKVTLPHFLVELYLSGQPPSSEIRRCLQLCIDLLPDSLYMLCPINRTANFQLDVVSRIICLTNPQNIDMVVDLLQYIRTVFSGYFESAANYRQIVEAHRDSPNLRERLLPLFS